MRTCRRCAVDSLISTGEEIAWCDAALHVTLHSRNPDSPTPVAKILTLPDSHTAPLTIRAKALVFHDPQSRVLLDHVERLARSDATVLVTGETGTGKELIARHIHATSGRAGPFVAVNCGAFSETLIDAELFGHEAGAFTGASARARRLVRGGQRRHAVPRRDRRPADVAAGQAAARAAGAPGGAPRLAPADRARRAPGRRDQHRPRARGRGAALPRRPVLPPQRGRRAPAGAARTPGRHPAAGRALHRRVLQPPGHPAGAVERGGRRRAARTTAGRATSASWRTSSTTR